jgi:hypothetical protein
MAGSTMPDCDAIVICAGGMSPVRQRVAVSEVGVYLGTANRDGKFDLSTLTTSRYRD